jgi:hypothetical protein
MRYRLFTHGTFSQWRADCALAERPTFTRQRMNSMPKLDGRRLIEDFDNWGLFLVVFVSWENGFVSAGESFRRLCTYETPDRD